MKKNPRGDPFVNYNKLVNNLSNFIDRIDLLWCLELTKELGYYEIELIIICERSQREIGTIKLTVNPYLEEITNLKLKLPNNEFAYPEFLLLIKDLIGDNIKDLVINHKHTLIQLENKPETLLKISKLINYIGTLKKCRGINITCNVSLEDRGVE